VAVYPEFRVVFLVGFEGLNYFCYGVYAFGGVAILHFSANDLFGA
jgi:hypothetical protein